MQHTVVLFDIDGTLITAGGAGRRALQSAFERMVGSADGLDFNLAGMTDPAIVRQALRRSDGAEVSNEQEMVPRLLAAYVHFLAQEVPVSPGYRVHPGVTDVLDQTERQRDRVASGLGTGNLEAGARIKLTRGELSERFRFGGFGSDHEDRAELLRIGAQRGAAQLGAPHDQCRVVVVGDTPRDVRAARAIGAQCVAVATGPFSCDELHEAGATRVFPDLAQPGAAAAILGN